MTRLWPDGQAIEVTQDEQGTVTTFTWRKRTYHVAEVNQQWRVDANWWRRRAWRTYYKLATGTGLLVIIYQDLETQQWYLQRLYD
jgi:hypothetical protein